MQTRKIFVQANTIYGRLLNVVGMKTAENLMNVGVGGQFMAGKTSR